MNTSPLSFCVLACCVSTAQDAGDDGPDKIRIILDTDANNELDDQHGTRLTSDPAQNPSGANSGLLLSKHRMTR